MVFEASVPNLGLPLGSGGRYDNFIEKFGKLKLPATGFAIEIGQLLQALAAQGFEIPKKTKTKVVVSSNSRNTAVNAVKSLRNNGVIASLELTNRSFEKTIEYGKLTGMDYAILVDSDILDSITVFYIKSNVSETMSLEAFLRVIGG